MQVALEDQTPLRGDFVLRAVQRFDLTPITSTLELMVRADDSLAGRIAVGTVLLAGSSLDRYRVAKIRKATSDWVQNSSGPAEVLDITAIIDGLYGLALPLARAVVKEGKSFGEVYRSCGATARVTADIPVGRFSCMVGDFPTPGIADALQEEACVPVWKPGASIAFTRLADLFTGLPVVAIERDSTIALDSSFLEQHEIPRAISTAPDGFMVQGRNDIPRGFVYLPRTSARVLDNMTRCLVVRRVLPGQFNGGIRAGDGIDVAGVRHVVSTVAHTWENGAATASGGDQSTRAWLAQLHK